MKKLLLVMVVALALLLSACQGGITSIFGAQANYSGLSKTIESLDEYHTFVTEEKMHPQFVYYPNYDALGSFKFFIYDPSNPEKLLYRYGYRDANDFQYSINITHAKKFADKGYKEIEVLPAGMENMLTLPDSAKQPHAYQTYTRHGLTYVFLNTEFYDFEWTDGNIRYNIHGSTSFENYPLNGEETIFTRLLSIDENVSKAAFEELKAHMKANS